MKSRVILTIIGVIVLISIIAGACTAGFVAGKVIQTDEVTSYLVLPGQDKPLIEIPKPGTAGKAEEELFVPFWLAWKLIHEQYVNQPVDDVTLMRGAIKGLVEALGDEHSSYIDPELLEDFNAQISGEAYEGIGAWVDTTSDYLTIISPMLGSPAEKAGLRSGDQIIAIDGEDMTGIDGELVRQRVLGPAGSTVTLMIRRPGEEEPFEVKLIRASIKSSNVMGRMVDEDIAYIRLLSFGDQNTVDDLSTTLDRLLAEKPIGIILDLRNNGGGLLNTAVDVASEFIADGVILYEQYGDGRKVTFESHGNGRATEIPLVVLINEGSASASEVVAGAIQDTNRAKLVGVTSYGKGSVQIWTDLPDDQGGVRITVARWLTPDGRTIQGIGLTPDYIIEITEDDINSGKDPQLEKAIQLLSGK